MIYGIRCPYMKAIFLDGARVCVVCACEGAECKTQVESDAFDLFLACNCRRKEGYMCHARFVWSYGRIWHPTAHGILPLPALPRIREGCQGARPSGRAAQALALDSPLVASTLRHGEDGGNPAAWRQAETSAAAPCREGTRRDPTRAARRRPGVGADCTRPTFQHAAAAPIGGVAEA